MDVEFERYFDSQLLGRSVANTHWVLIIPGARLLSDPDAGLTDLIGDEYEEGISDIKWVLKTYSHTRG